MSQLGVVAGRAKSDVTGRAMVTTGVRRPAETERLTPDPVAHLATSVPPPSSLSHHCAAFV